MCVSTDKSVYVSGELDKLEMCIIHLNWLDWIFLFEVLPTHLPLIRSSGQVSHQKNSKGIGNLNK